MMVVFKTFPKAVIYAPSGVMLSTKLITLRKLIFRLDISILLDKVRTQQIANWSDSVYTNSGAQWGQLSQVMD